MDKIAYVRRLEFISSDDPRIRTSILSLIPAREAVVESNVNTLDGRDFVTYSDLAEAQIQNFDAKAQWFQDNCAALAIEW